MKRLITTEETEVFNYLNDLRESGVTNMFGAGEYIENEFAVTKQLARKFLSSWMKNYKSDGNYDSIIIEVN